MKPEKKNLTMLVPSRQSLVYLPLVLAEQLGFFQHMGLELELTEQPSNVKAQQMLMSGAADVVCGSIENVLQFQSKGQFCQSFVLIGRAPNMALGLASRLSGFSSAGDRELQSLLRGRKIGVMALGSASHTVACAVLRKAGIKSDEVSFVSVGSAVSAAGALRAGQIDALVHTDPLMMQLQQLGEIKILAEMRDPAATLKSTGLELHSSCLYSTPENLQRLPGTLQAVSDAMLMALRWLFNASLLNITKILPDGVMGDDRQAFVASLERSRHAFSLDGKHSTKAVMNVLEAMIMADPALYLLNIDAARCFTNQFVARSAGKRADLGA